MFGNSLAKIKKSLFARDPQSLSLPPEIGGPTGITMEGRRWVEIDGCRGLCTYNQNCIAVRVKEGVLSVYGEELCLKIYRGARIAVCGRVGGVSFDGDGGKK